MNPFTTEKERERETYSLQEVIGADGFALSKVFPRDRIRALCLVEPVSPPSMFIPARPPPIPPKPPIPPICGIDVIPAIPIPGIFGIPRIPAMPWKWMVKDRKNDIDKSEAFQN